MNFLGQKIKSSLYQQTQNLKFNILINANIQNIKNLPPKQKDGPSMTRLPQSSLIPLSRLSNIKEHTMQLNIEAKINQLKKRSYSEKKLMTQTNLQDAKIVQQPQAKKRKRLFSASSSSQIKIPSLSSNLIIQKQKIASKQSLHERINEKSSKSYLNGQKRNREMMPGSQGQLQQTKMDLKQRKSQPKLKNVNPIQSERIMNLSLQPTADKLSLKAKLISFTEKHPQNQLNLASNTKLPAQNKLFTHQQLMNSLSNNLVLFAKDGRLFEQSVDYAQFISLIEKKSLSNLFYAQNISSHLASIKKFVLKYNVNSSIQVNKILSFENRKLVSNWEILNIFQNWNQILRNNLKGNYVQIVGIKFHYPDKKKGMIIAANTIKGFFRLIKEKKEKKKMASLMYKVIKIQRIWRRLLMVKKFRQQMISNAQRKLEQCQKLQQKFTSNYQLIKTSRKVEVHIGSLSFQQFKRITIENRSHFEMSQISRVFKALESPDTFIIYVMPFQLSDDLIKYYQRLFKIATGSDQVMKERVYFIYPENTQKISKLGELNTLNYLLCSPKALKRIRILIKSISSPLNSYIIPSYPSIEYTNLSYELKIPIYSSSMTLSKLYSTKIGYRQIILPIIQKQQANPPFKLLKSVSSIFSEKELINTLALLIYKNQETKRWYFKIDDEFASRGIAYFNVNSINLLKKLNSQHNEDVLSDIFGTQKEIIQLIAGELKQKLKSRLKILNKSIYPTYNQFITHFLTRGGIIEAAPSLSQSEARQVSISFLIEPNGDFQILGSFNKLQLNSKSVSGVVQYPAKKCSQIDVEKIVRHLYRRIYLKMKLFGYFTIDLLVLDSKEYHQSPYVIGLSCFLTPQTSALFLLKQLGKVRYDKDLNLFFKLQNLSNQSDISSLQSSKITKIEFQNQQQKQSSDSKSQISSQNKAQDQQKKNVSFLYCPKIILPGLEPMSQFFKKCKFQNIAFDLKTLLGTLFLPLDELQCQNIGFMVCQDKELLMSFELLKIVQFLSKNYRKNPQNKGKQKKSFSKRQMDEVGILRGALLAEIQKSQEYKKAEKQSLKQKNCEATFNNLQFF